MSEFEVTLQALKFNVPEAATAELILELQTDGYITEQAVKELLSESQFAVNTLRKSDDPAQVTDIIAPPLQHRINKDIDKNLRMMLDKLSSRYRMFREFYRHFDR
jgi:hypothetical protein